MEREVLNAQGNAVGKVTIPPVLLAVPVKPDVLHQVVSSQVRTYIKKTASALGKAEVRGGGRKPYRQKGTGRARAGSIRSPLWRGGGVIFGPKPRLDESKPPRGLRRLAFKMAWSERFASDAVVILRDFGLEKISTKGLLANLLAWGAMGRALMAPVEKDETLTKSARNLTPHPKKLYAGKIKAVSVKPIDQVTVYDVLLADRIFLTEESLERLLVRIERVQ